MKLFNKIFNTKFWFPAFVAGALIGPGIGYSRFYFFHVALVFWVISYIRENNLKTIFNELKQPQAKMLNALFLVTFAWFSLSFIWAENKMYVVQYLIFWLFGAAICYAVFVSVKSKNDFNKLTLTLAIAFAVEMLISLLEITTDFRWPISRFSDYAHFFGRTNDFKELAVSTPYAREYLASSPTGFSWNPNQLATLITLFFPFALIHSNRLYSIAATLLLVLVIVFCGARASFISALLMCIAALFFVNGKQRLSIVFIIVVMIAALTNGFTFRESHFRKTNELSEMFIRQKKQPGIETKESHTSVMSRKELIMQGLSLAVETKGLGVGGGNFKFQREKMNTDTMKVIVDMHNHWVEILAEGGVLYALFYFLWYGSLLFFLYRFYQSTTGETKYFAAAATLSLIGFVMGAIGPSSCIYFLPMYLAFAYFLVILKLNTTEK